MLFDLNEESVGRNVWAVLDMMVKCLKSCVGLVCDDKTKPIEEA